MVKLFGCEHVLFFKTKGKMTLKGNSEIIGPASLVSKCEGGDTTSISTGQTVVLLEPCGWGHLEPWGGNLLPEVEPQGWCRQSSGS